VDRQADRVRALTEDLARRHRVETHSLVQDLCDARAAERVHARTKELGLSVHTLVNNAGFHLDKLVRDLPWQPIRDNIALLLDAVVGMTQRFLPEMIAKGSGQVINVASVSGFMPGGVRLATYSSAKSFLIPFTEGLDWELRGTGVRATVVCPGFTRTDLYESSGLTDVRDAVPPFLWLEPDAVALEGLQAASQGAALRVTGLANRMIVAASKVVPRALLRERTRVFHREARRGAGSRGEEGPTRRSPTAALVTGASAGIGASFAEVLARRGYDVVLAARRRPLLEQRAQELSQRYGVRTHVVAKDLSAPGAVEELHHELGTLGWPIDVLVNNAGYPVNALFSSMSMREVDAALELMVRGVVELTHRSLPGMMERGWGRIINVASLAGFEPGSYRSTLYSSAKAFVIAFSESVDAELQSTGVRVTALCPGFTRTEWASKAGLGGGSVPALLQMDSIDVAQEGWEAAVRGVPVAVVGTVPQRLLSAALRLGPREAIGRFLSERRHKMLADAGPSAAGQGGGHPHTPGGMERT
jgi:short-subunit dehydrogenase